MRLLRLALLLLVSCDKAPADAPLLSIRSDDIKAHQTVLASDEFELTGAVARDSDARRTEREAQKKERFVAERKRKRGAGPPGA